MLMGECSVQATVLMGGISFEYVRILFIPSAPETCVCVCLCTCMCVAFLLDCLAEVGVFMLMHCMYICGSMCSYTYTCICMCACMCMSVYVCACICMSVCMCARACVFMCVHG